MTRLLSVVLILVVVAGACAGSVDPVAEVAIAAQPTVEPLPGSTPAAQAERQERVPAPQPGPTPNIDVVAGAHKSALTSTRAFGNSAYLCLDVARNIDDVHNPAGFLERIVGGVTWWVEVETASIEPDSSEWALSGDLVVATPAGIDGVPAEVPIRLGSLYGSIIEAGVEQVLVPVRIFDVDDEVHAVSSGALVPAQDGSWHFVLSCHDRQIDAIRDVFVQRGGSDKVGSFNSWLTTLAGYHEAGMSRPDQQQVAQIVQQLNPDRGVVQDEMTSWDQRSPLERNLMDAPPEVAAKFESELFLFDVPDAWYGAASVLCTRTRSGWNACYDFARPQDSQEPIPMEILRLPGEQVEVTLSASTTTLATDSTSIATVDAALLDTATLFEVTFEQGLATPTQTLTRGPDSVTITSIENLD